LGSVARILFAALTVSEIVEARRKYPKSRMTAGIRGWAGTMWNKSNPDKTLQRKLQRPPYWRLIQLLRQLRLKYREHDRNEPTFHITVPDFGLLFKFRASQSFSEYAGWDQVEVDLDNYAAKEIEFGRDLMFLLIAKGYMAYLRDKERGSSQLFRHFLITEGWAQRILDKRLELYKNEPRHRFMIEETKRLQKMPVHYVVMHYPSYFDYLW
jgi:hypothetical protein